VSHSGLAIYIKKYLKAKEEIMETQMFHNIGFFFFFFWQIRKKKKTKKKKKAGESNKGIFETKKTFAIF